MHKKILVQAAALVLPGLIATAAMASDNKQVQPRETSSAGSLQLAFIDPVTKKLRAATPEEAARFAKSLDAQRALQAKLPSTSGRPRTEAESQKRARAIRVNGVDMVVVETPETEFNHLVGMVDANGNLVGAHSADAAANAGVTK
jgi:hypothetical protein